MKRKHRLAQPLVSLNLILMVAAFASMNAQAADRMVLIENFTAAS